MSLEAAKGRWEAEAKLVTKLQVLTVLLKHRAQSKKQERNACNDDVERLANPHSRACTRSMHGCQTN